MWQPCHFSHGANLQALQRSKDFEPRTESKDYMPVKYLDRNLSSNSLAGTLASGLGQGSLVSLDLSSNELTGGIPESLGSSNLKVVLLNNNQLDGQVPEKLYSIGVHGGIIE
ncbi:hypothetical protein GW17_00031558 [Ensete ventricosum]|nr:hypothetical protein GW17_00031558 [Ensete ventricosum]RZR86444.1 hypothetical protein BHM03_00013654 [Ensete ventricosum]